MADYIERQAAISDFEWCKSQAIDKDRWQEAIDRINALPSAQPEKCEDCGNFNKTMLLIPQPKIIRCKDCRWYKTNYMWNGTEVKICAKEAYEPSRNADDYCSYGERKDG